MPVARLAGRRRGPPGARWLQPRRPGVALAIAGRRTLAAGRPGQRPESHGSGVLDRRQLADVRFLNAKPLIAAVQGAARRTARPRRNTPVCVTPPPCVLDGADQRRRAGGRARCPCLPAPRRVLQAGAPGRQTPHDPRLGPPGRHLRDSGDHRPRQHQRTLAHTLAAARTPASPAASVAALVSSVTAASLGHGGLTIADSACREMGYRHRSAF
jgi:hypothetical protein